MIEQTLKDAVSNNWPMLLIFTVVIVTIRITYLVVHKDKFVLYKELFMLAFLIYAMLLFYVVTFQDVNYGTNNFIPFKEILRYKVGSKVFIRNILGNILLFVPFGLFVSHYIKNKKMYPILLISVLVSCSIEFAQTKIGRTADIDDVILNTLGGVIGYFIYKFSGKLIEKLPNFMKNQIFLDILCLVIILIIIYISFKFNFWRLLSWIM